MAEEQSLYANFHDLVGLEIETSSTQIRDYFYGEYRDHAVERLPADLPRVRLQACLDGWVGPPKKNFTKTSRNILARWQYRIHVAENRVDIEAGTNRFGIPMIHHMLLHPSLRYLTAKQGTVMLHASAVSGHGNSLILTGKGGTGKTTTASLLLADDELDMSPQADDYVFLDPRGRSLAYWTRSHLYRDLLVTVPELSPRLRWDERLKVRLFSLLRTWSADHIKWPTRVAMHRLWPTKTLQKEAEPEAILLLSRANGMEKPALQPLEDINLVVQELIGINFYEARHFLELLRENLDGSTVDALLQEWRDMEADLFQELLHDVPAYRLILPKTQDKLPKRGESLRGLVSGLLLTHE